MKERDEQKKMQQACRQTQIKETKSKLEETQHVGNRRSLCVISRQRAMR